MHKVADRTSFNQFSHYGEVTRLLHLNQEVIYQSKELTAIPSIPSIYHFTAPSFTSLFTFFTHYDIVIYIAVYVY